MPNLNIRFPMKRGGYGFPRMNTTSKSALRENLKNVFLTLPNQRLVNGSIGSNIRSIIFETGYDSEIKDKLKAESRRVMNTFFPEVTLLSVEVESQDDNLSIDRNTYVVKISYAPQGILSQQDLITFSLNGSRSVSDRSIVDPEFRKARRKAREEKNL